MRACRAEVIRRFIEHASYPQHFQFELSLIQETLRGRSSRRYGATGNLGHLPLGAGRRKTVSCTTTYHLFIMHQRRVLIISMSNFVFKATINQISLDSPGYRGNGHIAKPLGLAGQELMSNFDSLMEDLLEHGHLVITWLSIMMTLISMMSPLQLAAVTNELTSRQINASVQKNRGLY